MSTEPSDNLLRGMKVLFGLLTAAMAVLSQTLIRDDLIPEQIKFVGSIGALFILVALLVTLGYHPKLRKRLAVWIGIALVALVALVLLQVRYVATLENFGSPPGTYKYLVGFSLTPEGNRMRDVLGRNKSETEFVAEMGVDRIPVAYGLSYYTNATIYSISYLAFAFSFVLALGSLIIPERQAQPSPPLVPNNSRGGGEDSGRSKTTGDGTGSRSNKDPMAAQQGAN